MEKILLDTDIGGDIDDALCLAYLLQEPQCQLLGITTVCGASETRASIADAICRSAGRKVPIAAGLDTPLQPIPLYPTPDGASALANWPHDAYEKTDAPAFLYQAIKSNPHEVTLIGIGNMTNIAVLFERYPDTPALLKGLTVMNGYFGDAPLPEPWHNWNSWSDPLASSIVFSLRGPVHRAISLDVTARLSLPAEQAKLLFPRQTPLLQAVLDFGAAWLQSAQMLTLHDPLAAVSVFHPEICSFVRGDVSVETNDPAKMGATRFTQNDAGAVEISTEVNVPLFYQLLSQTLVPA